MTYLNKYSKLAQAVPPACGGRSRYLVNARIELLIRTFTNANIYFLFLSVLSSLVTIQISLQELYRVLNDRFGKIMLVRSEVQGRRLRGSEALSGGSWSEFELRTS